MIELAAQAREMVPGTLGSIIHDLNLLMGMGKIDANEGYVIYKAVQFLEELQEAHGARYTGQARVTPADATKPATDVPIASDAVYRALSSVRTEHGDALSDRSCYALADAIDEIIDLRIRNYSSKEV